ncbi:MAG TPA: nucleotidyltransferase family protein [Usitatibacter sp.]
MSTVRGLLLCGGKASRFGSDKLVANLDGQPLVAHSVRHLLAGAGNALAVIPPGSKALRRILDDSGCDVLVSADCVRGMGASLAAGVAARPDAGGWIVALGDMPFVKPITIAAIVDKIEKGALIAAPVYQGIRGHPVGFSARLKDELLALDGDEGARSVLVHHRDGFEALPVTDAGVAADIDVPADLLKPKGD